LESSVLIGGARAITKMLSITTCSLRSFNLLSLNELLEVNYVLCENTSCNSDMRGMVLGLNSFEKDSFTL
jgi:hypothetical protein